MLPNPLHPAIVHFPVVLAFLLPFFAVGALWAIRRGARPRRAWSIPLALAVALTASAWAAVETGEAQDERVERVVAEQPLSAHEEMAETFLAASAGVALVAAAGLVGGLAGRAARATAVIGSLALVVGAALVGHSGGQLVYRHGAASAYASGQPSPADSTRATRTLARGVDRRAEGTTMSDECGECPIASASRRAFLRDAALAVVGALALTTAGSPAIALAESVIATKPLRVLGTRRTYGIPTGDSISVDAPNDVIIARWQNRVYAFSLKCPHRGTRLEWHSDEQRVFCPKHKARFQPDGTHDSGRHSRDLDRYDVSRQGGALAVDLDVLRRADQEPDAWRAAVIVLAK